MKNLKSKKVDMGVALSSQNKTISSKLVTPKTKTMKTKQTSNEMKPILYNKGGIETFTRFLTDICYGIGKNPFRTIAGYVKSVEKAFELLALTPKQQEELIRISQVKILLVQLEGRVNLRLNKTEAGNILCAFHKYVSFIKWLNDDDSNGTTAIIPNRPIVPISPIQQKQGHRIAA